VSKAICKIYVDDIRHLVDVASVLDEAVPPEQREHIRFVYYQPTPEERLARLRIQKARNVWYINQARIRLARLRAANAADDCYVQEAVMGLDKEATDIWKFGRIRPDLTVEQTVAAPWPHDVPPEEENRRRKLVAERLSPNPEALYEKLKKIMPPPPC
jgi:hypothetical protein